MEININEIKSPADIKSMDTRQLGTLCDRLREALVAKLAAHGGHVGPNLGVVEATVALHYVFDAPKDKIVFDVSHQSYVHKMLTGRIGAFTDPTRYDEVTGYTSPAESEYDLFEVGHTSTSISLATGLAKARDLSGGNENVIAFIGDASLGGGMALEALNYAPELHSNIIIVLNDNQMSIAENHGELYAHLNRLRESNGMDRDNIFRALGYEYIYVDNGNDISSLIEAYDKAKGQSHAVLIHINTIKGKGLPCAESRKEAFHYNGPFDPKTGAGLYTTPSESYGGLFAQQMLRHMHSDPRVVTLTAGTPGAIGCGPELRNAAGNQFIDVGIAEQDCVSMAAGLAKGGAKPVMGVVASFIQRAYDQMSHDVAINNLPVTFVEFYTGMFGMNDVTHLGFFDIALLSNIPNITMLAPTSAEEFTAMLDHAIRSASGPIVIRTPGGSVSHRDTPVDTDFSKYEVVMQGSDIAIIAAGPFLDTAMKAAQLLRDKGVTPTIINPRILSRIDTSYLDSLTNYKHVITIEDGIIDGGFGQKVAAYLGKAPIKVTCLGLKKEFVDRYNITDLLTANFLTPAQIAEIASH